MFDYCAVLIAVILGLALIHLVRGLAKLIQMRHEVRPYWVQVVWTFNVIIWVLVIWFGMYWWRGLQELSIQWFFFLIVYAILQFIWAAILYPPELPRGLDFKDYFFANRHWFFAIQATVVLMDIPETLAKSTAHLRAMPRQYPFLIASLLAICAVGMFSNRRHVQALLSIAWLVLTLSYVFFIPLMARIAGH